MSYQFVGTVTPQEMAAIIDADEPRSTIPAASEFRRGIEERMKRAALAVFGYPTFPPIIRALNDEGFAVMDKASGSEVLP